ncbi:hypothetical protein Pr1d_21660 [Bythopirellula goksoeyrii]|uniref:Uncharacterized protein n=1 Tax=Bythopirellula goksoeyrii TaxID=1400387 RepID=A0A5B9Q782_9BACT|nr:hypothetical protein Pr1d_21660 [Bythopirellula goksoeyrii]
MAYSNQGRLQQQIGCAKRRHGASRTYYRNAVAYRSPGFARASLR